MNDFLVFVTFDLVNGTNEDYETAYGILEAYGFKSVGEHVGRPTVKLTTAMILRTSGPSAVTVCDAVRKELVAAFQRAGFKADLAVMVGTALSVTRIPDDLKAIAPQLAPVPWAPRP